MKTSVTGFPRIGADRELKRAVEGYWKGSVSESELKERAKAIRLENINRQKNSGMDFISSGDFSYYDNMLDTAVMVGAVPARYKNAELSELDTYFAMARGHQDASVDVRALAMKKWFNTNYHYIVPEIDDDTVLELNPAKSVSEYREALQNGVTTKVHIIGPYTFLKLARFTGNKGINDFALPLAQVYSKLLEILAEEKAQWVQIDEPALVKDMTQDDICLFEKIYEKVLSAKNSAGQVKVLLQTYFGDIRDVYEKVVSMDFDAVGLDLIEGAENFELIKKYGFPENKILFAGLVNGKNIWINNFEKTLGELEQIKNFTSAEIVISTSCSLLHVPYDLDSETSLPSEYRKYLSFAVQKLDELSALGKLAGISGSGENIESRSNGADSENKSKASAEILKLYDENKARFCVHRPDSRDEKVQERVKAIKEEDCRRTPEFNEREKVQKEKFGLPLLPTTTIGSFPQTADVKKIRREFKKGEVSKEEYVSFIKEKIKRCVKFQEDIGIDVLVHGEYERNDMVEYFGEHLSGYIFTEKAWVQSYGTRCVKPPVIWGDVSRIRPITVEWSSYAQSLTNKPVKGMLTGPVTILNWSFPREDISIKESILQIALAIRDEVLDLEKAGISIIQIDEAALREKLPIRKNDWYKKYLDFAIPAFRLVSSGVKPETQIHTHMCYSEFTDIIPAIDDMDADVITFEASRSDLAILDSLKENNFRTEVGPGVYDIHSPRVPSVDEITSAIRKMETKVDVKKLWVNPDCGLKTRGEAETEASLKNLVKAAHVCREELS